MHLDYEKHPRLINKQRRLNVILFANEAWEDAWQGDLQLWEGANGLPPPAAESASAESDSDGDGNK